MQGEFKENGKEKLGASGSFGRNDEGLDQLDQLKKDLEQNTEILSADYKVVCVHHGPFCDDLFHKLRPKDCKKLYSVIKGKVDALLFGHEHKHKDWYQEGIDTTSDKDLDRDVSDVPEDGDGNIFGDDFKQYDWDNPALWEISRIYDGGSSTMMGGNESPHRIIDLSLSREHDIPGNFY